VGRRGASILECGRVNLAGDEQQEGEVRQRQDQRTLPQHGRGDPKAFGQGQRPLLPAGARAPHVRRGKLARFSMERLERFLNALDMEVRIQVGPKPKDKERAGISVELVSSF
jgi:hypothetical protein